VTSLNNPFWSRLSFQNLISQVYNRLESLHDFVTVWLAAILGLVCLIRWYTLLRPKRHLPGDSETLEKTWTLIPMLVLVRVAGPRIRLLCLQDAIRQTPTHTTKVISNQWNWQRETLDTYDHLLDVERLDNLASFEIPVRIVRQGVCRLLVTSTDVLHSLGVPRLGIKLDSIPGRLNTTTTEIFRPTCSLGSCYELCGRGHRAIPIHLLSV